MLTPLLQHIDAQEDESKDGEAKAAQGIAPAVLLTATGTQSVSWTMPHIIVAPAALLAARIILSGSLMELPIMLVDSWYK